MLVDTSPVWWRFRVYGESGLLCWSVILFKDVHLGWLGISLGERNRLNHFRIGESLERQTHLLVSLEEIRKGHRYVTRNEDCCLCSSRSCHAWWCQRCADDRHCICGNRNLQCQSLPKHQRPCYREAIQPNLQIG